MITTAISERGREYHLKGILASVENAVRFSVSLEKALLLLKERFGADVAESMVKRNHKLEELLCGSARIALAIQETRLTSPDIMENEIDSFYKLLICSSDEQWYIVRYFVGRGPSGTWKDRVRYRFSLRKVSRNGAVRFFQAEYHNCVAGIVGQNLDAQRLP